MIPALSLSIRANTAASGKVAPIVIKMPAITHNLHAPIVMNIIKATWTMSMEALADMSTAV
jgi:hypothetical protein